MAQVETTVKTTVTATATDPADLSNPTDALRKTTTTKLTNGTGANKNNDSFHDERQLLTGASETLDLTDGTLKNKFGAALVFTQIKVIRIINKSLVDGLIVGAAGANSFSSFLGDKSDTLLILPGGEVTLTAPVTGFNVSAGTDDELKLEHDGTTTAPLDYDIILTGDV